MMLCFVAGFFVIYRLLSKSAPDSKSKPRPNPETVTPKNKPPPSSKPEPPINISEQWHIILGVPPNAHISLISDAYKTMISQYHPDKVAALGPELRSLAEKKSKEINAAYQYIRQRR